MAARAFLLLVALALVPPTSTLAAAATGGTGVPAGQNGAAQSIPGEPAQPVAPHASRAPAPVAAATHPAPAPPPLRAARPPIAESGQADGGRQTVEVSVPKPAPVAAAPRAAEPATGGLPTTGFDLGRMAAVAMLMIGAGLFISATVGPRPRRAL